MRHPTVNEVPRQNRPRSRETSHRRTPHTVYRTDPPRDIAPSGQLEHVSVILATLDPAEFYSLKTDAETLRTFLDQAWQLVDSDVKGASWRAEWRSGAIDIEVYWSDPSRDEPPVEAALHIAFSPVKATDVQPTTAWKAILHDSARDIVYAPEIWCEPPATTLRVVRFVSANGALVGSVTVFSPSDIGATGDGGDAISVRTLATTMAINLAEDDVPQVQGRALLEDALAASRWGQTITVLVDGQPYAAWALECRAGLWAVYLRMDALLVAAAFRTDPRNLSLHVTTAACCNAEVSAGPARAVEVDERDSHWEVNSPTFRVYIHDSETDTTRGATATYDITGVDVLQAVDWAQRHTRDDQTWALALVLDDEATEALSPGHGRGLVWLLGADGNDSDTAPTSARHNAGCWISGPPAVTHREGIHLQRHSPSRPFFTVGTTKKLTPPTSPLQIGLRQAK